MIIHIYDAQNQTKIGQLSASDFTRISINRNIDDFNSATLQHTFNGNISEVGLQGFENLYIEDETGEIIFGGILASYSITSKQNTLNLLDHRWVLSRLILDNVLNVNAGDDVIDTVETLIDLAKAKRSIPLVFDREASEFNTTFEADLRFEIGDDFASSIQKIIQTVYARWAVEYSFIGNDIIGKLRVRSVRGVTPEGIGRASGYFTNESGEIITMRYEEGGELNSIQDFTLTYDLSSYTSRTTVGTKIGGVNNFIVTPPEGNSAFFENTFGRTEGYITDYKANSVQTAHVVSTISQVPPRIDIEVLINPKSGIRIIPGDRVNLIIDTPLLQGVSGNLVRVDAISYNFRDGIFERTALLNFVSPQKRVGTTGLLQKISQLDTQLDGLNKNYLTN